MRSVRIRSLARAIRLLHGCGGDKKGARDLLGGEAADLAERQGNPGVLRQQVATGEDEAKLVVLDGFVVRPSGSMERSRCLGPTAASRASSRPRRRRASMPLNLPTTRARRGDCGACLARPLLQGRLEGLLEASSAGRSRRAGGSAWPIPFATRRGRAPRPVRLAFVESILRTRVELVLGALARDYLFALTPFAGRFLRWKGIRGSSPSRTDERCTPAERSGALAELTIPGRT